MQIAFCSRKLHGSCGENHSLRRFAKITALSMLLAYMSRDDRCMMKEAMKSAPGIHLGLDAAHLALDRITVMLEECAYGIENEPAKWEIIELILALRQCAFTATTTELDRVLCNLEASAVLLYSAQGHQRFAGGVEGLKRELLACCANVRLTLPSLPAGDGFE